MFDQIFFEEIRKIIREEVADVMAQENMQRTEPETYLNQTQVEELTKLSKSTIENLIRRGELTVYRPTPRRRTFRLSEIQKLMTRKRSDYDENMQYKHT